MDTEQIKKSILEGEELGSLKANFHRLKEELSKAYKDQGELALKPILEKLFEKFPFLEGFSWSQYTPYFNDGDECEFGVNYDGAMILNKNDETFKDFNWGEYTYEDGYVDLEEHQESLTLPVENYIECSVSWRFEEKLKDHPICRAKDAVSEFVNSDEELFELIWGDHKRVLVTRKGITVEEYDHE